MHPRLLVRTGLRSLCDLGHELGGSMLEHHCSWGGSRASRAMGSFSTCSSVPGAGSCCWHHTPSCSTCSAEPLLRSGIKDRKYSSGWSKAPTTPGTECRRNSQRTPEGLVQGSCFYYRVIQDWIFNVCEQQMVLTPSIVEPCQETAPSVVGCVLPYSWLCASFQTQTCHVF